jgi:DNA-binding NtrC family response regulator
MVPRTILIVDDEAAVRGAIAAFFDAHGYHVLEAGTMHDGLETFATRNPDAVVLDYRLPDGNALDLLPKLQEVDAEIPIIILTGYGSIDLAVRAIQEGAAHFLTKPVEFQTLLVIMQRLMKQSRSNRRQLAQRPASAKNPLDPFIGSSPSIVQLREQTQRFLDTASPVLIVGETGSGKGVLARWIHDNGPRADEPMVHINCAGLTTAFLDAELFGHSKGAFTGATNAKPGLLEVANHGTVFLDEVADVDPEIQPKLLKVLEDKSYRRLGEVRDRTVDVRLIAATNRSLTEAVEDGRFRSDLYFRLCALPLRIPALRERPDDISRIAQLLLDNLAIELGRPDVRLSPEALKSLVSYSWPGNIRELRNVLERAILLADDDTVHGTDLQFGDLTPHGAAAPDTDLTLEEVEQRHIEAVLDEEQGHVGRAADRLGVPRSTLYKKLKRFGISTSRERAACGG